MRPVNGDRHDSRCLRFEGINWRAPVASFDKGTKTKIGEVVLEIDYLEKYYEVAANALFSGTEKKVVKANETLSFVAQESKTLAIVGESGCGKSTLAKVLMGVESATDGNVLLKEKEIGKTRSTSVQPRTSPRSRWYSRIRLTR